MSKGSRYTILPFTLHQFIAQTGSVYTTLDQDQNRFITLEPGIYKQDEQNRKPIFPNVFSRATGHPFICVSYLGDRFEPREFRESSDEEALSTDGYLIVGEDIWDVFVNLTWPPCDAHIWPTPWAKTLAQRSGKSNRDGRGRSEALRRAKRGAVRA
jgi:hypothetical protein